jgi:hypothetical protein
MTRAAQFKDSDTSEAYTHSTGTGKPHALAGIPGQRRRNCACRQQVMQRSSSSEMLHCIRLRTGCVGIDKSHSHEDG